MSQKCQTATLAVLLDHLVATGQKRSCDDKVDCFGNPAGADLPWRFSPNAIQWRMLPIGNRPRLIRTSGQLERDIAVQRD